jgi:hypothetical protein
MNTRQPPVNKKLRQAALDKLNTIQVDKGQGTEQIHIDADQVLCDLLVSLGYGDVVAEYNKVEKWFA